MSPRAQQKFDPKEINVNFQGIISEAIVRWQVHESIRISSTS